MKHFTQAVVIEQARLGEGIYSLWLECPEIAGEIRPGQFVSLFCRGEAHLLPRPISLCEVDASKGRIRLVYRVAGYGTAEFSGYLPGEKVKLMGPLGNTFPLMEGKAMLVGGGIGIPPMLALASALPGQKDMVLGYRDALFLTEDFAPLGQVLVATESGRYGTKGNVMQILNRLSVLPDVVYACGPTPMLRAIKVFAKEHRIPCYLSLEERMACGIGACLACTCNTKEVDAHSHVHNARVCADGPVFSAEEVEL